MRGHVKVESLVDNTLNINKNTWVVSIVRKPEGTTNNPEHAFLVVEGIDNTNNVFVRRYDLFMDQSREGYAVIALKEKSGLPSEIERKFNSMMYNDPQWAGAELYYKSWQIKREQGECLHQEIIQDMQNPPRYRVSGDRSISGYSNTGPSQKGDSCFTWARRKLWNLDERMKNDLPSEYRDLIASITSRYIGPKEEAKGLSDFAGLPSRS